MSATKNIGTMAALAVGTSYVFYRAIPSMMKAGMKLQANPPDDELGQILPEEGAPSYADIAKHGVIEGRSALIVGGTRGVGYGTALALAKSGASRITLVGRNKEVGARAVDRIQKEVPESNSGLIEFVQGDIGTVASTHQLVDVLEAMAEPSRYDYLIVTAAIFPQPKSRNPSPLNEDGVEKSFGIGVVGRFLLYRNAYRFLKPTTKSRGPSPMILNVCAAGEKMNMGFDRELVDSLAFPHFLNIANFAIGNELMLHKLAMEGSFGNSDGSEFRIPIITTHPGFLKTDLHRGQGLLMDIAEAIMVHFMGCTEEVCGRRQTSLLCAIGTKETCPSVTIVDHLGYGRKLNVEMESDIKKHGDWLWDLLLKLENGKD